MCDFWIKSNYVEPSGYCFLLILAASVTSSISSKTFTNPF